MSIFIDEVEVILKAGDGGNGAVTFRREKHVPRGGPNGGDGGRGGTVYLETDPHLSTLIEFRPGKVYRAQRGGDGTTGNQSGKDGQDIVLKVPIGTQVRDAATGEVLADMVHFPQREALVAGGRGGKGNSHFVSSVQQAPMFAEKGEPGEERVARMELKLLADVGLLGFPNVGKSTLLSRVSAAKPKIADYPFTTLIPNLGVVRLDEERNFVMADIPGLIENASEGAGLGIQFLKHLERTRLLVHLVDVSGMTGRDPLNDYEVINRELLAFSEDLAKLPQVIVLSRIDILPDREAVEPFVRHFEDQGLNVFPISSVTGENIDALVYHLWGLLEKMPVKDAPGADGPIHITVSSKRAAGEDPRRFTVERNGEGVLVVSGKGIERVVAMTDMENEIAVRRLQRQLERWGVFNELKAAGAEEGDTVRIRNVEFDYIDDEDPEAARADGEAEEADAGV